MAAQVIPFMFQQQHSVRVTLINGEAWFCLPDVCAILEIKNPSDLVAKQLDTKGVEKIYLLTPGGKQEVNCINEPNLYRVIFRSNKPEAKAFQDWVFSEVLPAIRKTGRYELPSAPPQPTLSAEQWRIIRNLVQRIAACCKFQERASHAVYERLRFLFGLRNASELRPEHFEAAKAELESLNVLAEQHLDRMATLDLEFIAAVIRPPVSIRKVRALVRKQAAQPPLTF